MTGRATARPVRIGLVFEPSAEMLRLAVEQAILLWGGQYQPFFRPGDLDRIERVSRRLGVDVLLALDRAGVSEEAAALDGYQWQGRDGWGPLAPAREHIKHRLLGPERLLDELPRDSWVLPDWAPDDPLDDLFRVWFGAYGTSAQCVSLQNLQKQLGARATQARIDDGAEVPADAASWITPVTATSGAIDYRGMSPGAAFVVVDPSDPESLMALWNARACGARAFPFPAGHEQRVLVAAESWLQQLLEEGELSGWIKGDGTPVGPRIYIWQATGPGELPETLTSLLTGRDVTLPYLSPRTPGKSGQAAGKGIIPSPRVTHTASLSRLKLRAGSPGYRSRELAERRTAAFPAATSSLFRWRSQLPRASGLTGRFLSLTSARMRGYCASTTASH